MHKLASLVAGLLHLASQPALAAGDPIDLVTNFPPLLIRDAPTEGAHPLGGPAMRFVRLANEGLAETGHTIVYNMTGAVPDSDAAFVRTFPGDLSGFATVYDAVAAGSEDGGADVGIGISNQNGLSFGELHVAALPFGLEADEFAAYLYDGGGLALQQSLYDRHFDDRLKVLPIAITPTQGGGWFPGALPDPESNPDLTPQSAMAALCRRPWIVRWPEPGAGIWARACKDAGVATGAIGAKTRCAHPDRDCPTADNPITSEVDRLTFGGFVPGIPPHVFIRTRNIDAYELNLPSTEVHMIRLATGQANLTAASAELKSVIGPAPYYYGQTWHQPVTYLELLINKRFWASLDPPVRWAIRTAAESATLRSWTSSLSRQGAGIDRLEKDGAIVLRWPEGLLSRLRDAADSYLTEKATNLAEEGDPDYRTVLEHMRTFQAAQARYGDFGDLNQGRAGLQSAPSRP